MSNRTISLLRGGEGVDVEYKTKITQEFNEILVAFANSDGGICIIGVEDHKDNKGRHIGKVVGIEISDRTRGKIQSRADQTNDKIEIIIETEYDEQGKGIYIVTILEGKNKPYCTGGGRYLIRRNGQNCAVSPNMMERIIEHRINTSPASQPIIRIQIDEIFLIPDIICQDNKSLESVRNSIEKEDRSRVVKLSGKVTNIGNLPAQNILIDANILFIERNPFGYALLPIHNPPFVDFLSTSSSGIETSKTNFSGTLPIL